MFYDERLRGGAISVLAGDPDDRSVLHADATARELKSAKARTRSTCLPVLPVTGRVDRKMTAD